MFSIDWPSIDWAWMAPILVGYAFAFAFAFALAVSLAVAADDGRLPHPPARSTEHLDARDADTDFDLDFATAPRWTPPTPLADIHDDGARAEYVLADADPEDWS